nr:uncharacterized protein LOC105342246 [Crassostrea gigas]
MTLILAFLLYCTFLPIWKSVVNSCSTGHLKSSEDACCVNFFKEKKFCKECPVGYIGVNCSHPCNPPLYGDLCSLRCECVKCHHIYGCVTDNTMSEPNVMTRALRNLRNLKIVVDERHTATDEYQIKQRKSKQ